MYYEPIQEFKIIAHIRISEEPRGSSNIFDVTSEQDHFILKVEEKEGKKVLKAEKI